MNIKIKNTNNLLAKLCSKYKWAIVQHGNINISNLNASGLHLNITGTATLAKNYINFLKHWLSLPKVSDLEYIYHICSIINNPDKTNLENVNQTSMATPNIDTLSNNSFKQD
jgi:hypothetical protein